MGKFYKKPEFRSAVTAIIFLGVFIAIMLNISCSYLLSFDNIFNSLAVKIQTPGLILSAKVLAYPFDSVKAVVLVTAVCIILFLKGMKKEFFLL